MPVLLLDTQALFWALYAPQHLRPAAKGALEDPDNEIYATLVSAQEIAMKIASGRWEDALDLLENFDARVTGAGFGLIVQEAADYSNVLHLPIVAGHRDPMDRLIIAQAMARRMILVSADQYAATYLGTDGVIDAGQAPRVSEPRRHIAARAAFRNISIQSHRS
ncbi:type II toxin-antitoxin system VapC family toxin [Azospirillum sp. SYSU D00513]|uniref:type II toxin-antitoxin system VapC family toxin n=1 Tax=Azospirillum sp. SYSU D00513 TaxID=2812561 RepID=UPI001A967F4D|nr:type II toxin-antitoxin system VapC family toxin [Azospirillum sp. SYSU D00513]